MTMNTAYRLFWLECFDAHDQTSREGFWKAFLANILVFIVFSVFSCGLLGLAYLVAIFIPKLAMVSRRLINAGMTQCSAEMLTGAEGALSVILAMLAIPMMLTAPMTFNLCAGILIAYKVLLLLFCAMPAVKKNK